MNKKWIRYTNITSTDAIVDGVHNFPDMLSEEEQLGGILVDDIPAPQQIDNQVPYLHINPQTLEMWYEYTDRTPTDTEKLVTQVEQLQADNANMTYALMMGGLL